MLIDTRDNLIILPKPINDATFVTARLLHIAIHINKLLLPMGLPALVAVVYYQGVGAILPFILMLLLATLLSIFLINAIYILILRIVPTSGFQTVISYLQIALAIVIYGSYQLLPRMAEEAGMDKLNILEIRHIAFYPPYWFADACSSLSVLKFGESNLYSLLLAIGVPFASIFIVVKYFAPAFNRKLSMIGSNAPELRKSASGKHVDTCHQLSLTERLASAFTRGGSEYMGFIFTWKMMSRSRDFKMKVYPSFGYVIVMMVLMVFRSKTLSLSDFSQMTAHGKTIFLVLVYFSSFILFTALGQVPFSEKYKAAWLFLISPLQTPGNVISGAVKAVMVYFYIPILLFFALPGLLLVGPVILPNMLLGCFNILTISSLIAYVNLRELPFSVSLQNASSGRTVTRNFLTMIIPLGIGIFHWLIFDYIWVVVIFAILAVIAAWMVLDSIRKLPWAKIGSVNTPD